MQVPPPLVVVERLIYRRVGDRLPDPDLCPVWEGPTEQVRDVTADEQGPDTADLDRILATFALYGGKEPPRESEGWYLRWALGEVRSLRGEITAARTERDTALAEYKALHKRCSMDERTQRAERAEAERDTALAERDRAVDQVGWAQAETESWGVTVRLQRERAVTAEAELAAVTAERDRWEKAALDWSEESVRHRGEIRRLGETLAVERKQAAQQPWDEGYAAGEERTNEWFDSTGNPYRAAECPLGGKMCGTPPSTTGCEATDCPLTQRAAVEETP